MIIKSNKKVCIWFLKLVNVCLKKQFEVIPRENFRIFIILDSIMPPKNNSIPIKPSESYTMTHEEEELQYEISKLRYQVQQVSILRREIEDEIDGLKEEMEAKLDGLKDQIIANMDDKLVQDHIEHQQQVLQLSNDNLTLVQNLMKQ